MLERHAAGGVSITHIVSAGPITCKSAQARNGIGLRGEDTEGIAARPSTVPSPEDTGILEFDAGVMAHLLENRESWSSDYGTSYYNVWRNQIRDQCTY